MAGRWLRVMAVLSLILVVLIVVWLLVTSGNVN